MGNHVAVLNASVEIGSLRARGFRGCFWWETVQIRKPSPTATNLASVTGTGCRECWIIFLHDFMGSNKWSYTEQGGSLGAFKGMYMHDVCMDVM